MDMGGRETLSEFLRPIRLQAAPEDSAAVQECAGVHSVDLRLGAARLFGPGGRMAESFSKRRAIPISHLTFTAEYSRESAPPEQCGRSVAR